jgi:hypothetical protein
VGEYETEADLVLAFLSENHDKAFTKPEIVKGVDFGEGYEPDSMLKRLLTLPDELVDVAGDLTASEMVDDDIAAALDSLVAEGTVDRKEIERDDGETVSYYRLAEV